MTRYDAVPDVLCARDQWVCWKTTERDGKQTKLPVDPRTKNMASVTDESTWSDFETARTVARDDGDLAGIGFVFTQRDSFVGVDLDAARDPETGRPDADAKAIVQRLDSYTEISPSGTGYHLIVNGALPSGGNRAGTVECYEHARFFTVTGNHVDGTPQTVRDRQTELEAVHRDYVADPNSSQNGQTGAPDERVSDRRTSGETRAASGVASAGNGLSDDAVLEKARDAKNAEKFTRLWRGTTTGYDSHSEADMALACHLAFWTAKDTAQMDRLFRDSGLYRAKWDDPHYSDGRTYGDATIERACQVTDDVYTPREEPTNETRTKPTTTATPDTESLARDVARLERTIETATTERDAIDDLATQVASLATQLETLADELAAEHRKRKRLETKVAMLAREREQSWWQRFRRSATHD